MSRRRSGRAGGALTLGLALALGACAGEDAWVEPRERLADRLHPAPGLWQRPSAALSDDRRTVLRGQRREPIGSGGAARLRADGRLRLLEPLPPALRRAERLVLAPRIRVDDGAWTRLRPQARRPPPGGWGSAIPIELDVGREHAGRLVRLVLEGIAPESAFAQRIEVPPVPIPPAGRLEFAIGVLPAAREQGPVRFRLSACREGRCQERFAETLDPRRAAAPAWQDRTLDLGDLAGQEVAFRFETRLLEPGVGAYSLPLWAHPTVLVPAARPPDAVNLILLSLDTLRADRLPTYGFPLDTAPFLDRLARRGTVFESFLAAATTTGPSHMTLFTSIEPSVLDQLGGLGRIWPRAATLAETLRGAGFETGAVTENVMIDPEQGFARGFDRYRENKSPQVLTGGGDSAATFALAREFLRDHVDRRFFLFLHTYQVHHPYVPAEGYRELFPDPPAGREPAPGLPPDRDPALYDREIRFLDDQIRGLHDTLERLGLADRTLLVITSDHGEEFLEHGGIGHGANVYGEVTNVPLIFVGPGVPAGRRISQAFGHRDLMPTLLDWLGVPVPATARGRSFAALLAGETAALEPRPVYTESWPPPIAKRGNTGLAVRLGDRKLIRAPGPGSVGAPGPGVVYRYFDLARDPWERRDRYGEAPGEAADLRRELDGYRGNAEAAAADLRRRHAAASEDRERVPQGRPDLLQEERLRALGYVE